jgi:hypothetical protein
VATPAPRPQHAGVKLPFVASVVPIEWLRGREAPEPDLAPDDMVRAVLAATGAPENAPRYGEIVKTADGWACRFLTTLDPRIARVRMGVVWEEDKTLTVKATENTLVMRRLAPPPEPTGLFGFGKKGPPEAGFEVFVQFPEPGQALSEVVATGRLFGNPPPEFLDTAHERIVSLIDGARASVEDVPERRAHPRVPAEFPVTLFPIHPDGRVETPQASRCVNVSAGGLAVRAAAKLPTNYTFVAFEGVRGTTGLALLLRVLRTTRVDNSLQIAGRFKLDLWPQDTK